MPRYIDADFVQLIADTELDDSGKGTVQWVLAHTPTADVEKEGYRKTADVAMEIFDEIEHPARAAIILLKFEKDEKIRNAKIKCYKDLIGYIAELKKKYIEQKDREQE